MDAENDSSEEVGLARNRSRRTKKISKKKGALELLKKARKGEKVAREEEADLVYDIVDEDQYTEVVRKRQEDDWIVDDDGAGYVEDGREIFDDDYDERPTENENKKKAKPRKNANIFKPESKTTSGNIRSMFIAAPKATTKKNEKAVTLEGDSVLGDIMAELQTGNELKPLHSNKANNSSRSERNPFSSPPHKKLKARSDGKSIKAVKNLQDSIEKSETEIVEVEETEAIKDEPKQDMEAFDDFDDDIPMIDVDTPTDTTQTKSSGLAVSTSSPPKQQFTSVKPVPVHHEPKQTWSYEGSSATSEAPVCDIDLSKLPLIHENGNQVLRMFWLDAYEDPYHQPGTVYLFGKVYVESAKCHVSCCVSVKNIERRVYLLPRETDKTSGEPVSMMNLYTEFNSNVAEKYKITPFKSRKVTRRYAFELTEVPAESEYLEVRYSASLPPLPANIQGNTFSHVFGINTSSLETFLLDRKIKGPCWLDLKSPVPNKAPMSWCKLEASVERPAFIEVSSVSQPPPPVSVLSLTLRTITPPNKPNQNEIAAISCLMNDNFRMDKPPPKDQLFTQHFTAVSKPHNVAMPFDFKQRSIREGKSLNIEATQSERALLAFSLAKIAKFDPDIIVGHDISGYDLDVLLHRLNVNKVPHWSRLGRLRRSNMPKHGNTRTSAVTAGRLLCDVKTSAHELLRCRSYDLTQLCNQILHVQRVEYDEQLMLQSYNDTRQLLGQLELSLIDARSSLALMYELNVIPLALQITNICGCLLSRTLLGGRSERNEWLLLHSFTEREFIVPDKTSRFKHNSQQNHDDEEDEHSKKKTGRRKPAYSGGLVLEPKKGFYDTYILLLDFNSLYPSIIQEYNICFTTVDKKLLNEEEEEIPDLPASDLEVGVLPTEIRKLVESRRAVKALMKQTDLSKEVSMQYDIRQKALKLTANSMYGCLGFTFSRFYAKPLAALVTSKGREILMNTKDLVEKMGLEVIYGDTDSIMINTGSTEFDTVFKLGNKVKQEVNKRYRLLEIDIDGVFGALLLLKKKKYAALMLERNAKTGEIRRTEELKGLDIVRRDWSLLAKQCGKFVIGRILSGENREKIVEAIHEKLMQVAEEMKQGDITNDCYTITKQLTKNPEDYPDKKSLPHVQVALRVNEKSGGKRLRGGDTVSYVVCEDGSNQPSSHRAYLLDELEKQGNLKIDTQYYLAHQLHPVVSRLCEPIDGTDAAHIAQCLGLDPSGYRHKYVDNSGDTEAALLAAQDADRFANCAALTFVCPGTDQKPCSAVRIISTALVSNESQHSPSLGSTCSDCNQLIPVDALKTRLLNTLTLQSRKFIQRYYQGWLTCEDSACGHRTRRMSLVTNRGRPYCTACNRALLHQEFTETQLYIQLNFYQHIFDLERAIQSLPAAERKAATASCRDMRPLYAELHSKASQILSRSAYSQVCLNSLFSGISLL